MKYKFRRKKHRRIFVASCLRSRATSRELSTTFLQFNAGILQMAGELSAAYTKISCHYDRLFMKWSNDPLRALNEDSSVSIERVPSACFSRWQRLQWPLSSWNFLTKEPLHIPQFIWKTFLRVTFLLTIYRLINFLVHVTNSYSRRRGYKN